MEKTKRKLSFKRLAYSVFTLFLAAAVLIASGVPVMAATVERCTLNIEQSTKYKYMSNWYYPDNRTGIHLATVASGTYKGEPAYCIEFGKDMGDDGISETVMDIDDVDAWSDLSSTAKKGITYATIYGYPNFNYGVSDEAAQAATQFIVWEYAKGYRTSADGDDPTAGLDGDSRTIQVEISAAGFDTRLRYYTSAVQEYSDIEKAYTGILNGIRDHKVVPSFKDETIELEWSSSNNRFEATVTDSNKVLENFDLSSSVSDLKFSVSGNKLTIYRDSAMSSTHTVTMTKTCTTTGADIGFTPDDPGENQSLVGRLSDPVTASFKVETAVGNAQIKKTSEDGVVSGIKFTLEGDGSTYSGKTDDDGVLLIENIPTGTYTVTEQSISRYVENESKTITISSGKTTTVSFKNVLKKFNVTLKKTDVETTSAQGDASLAGAVYGIYEDGVLVDKYTTGSDGKFTTDYYTCGSGWTIQEITPSEGYLLDETVYEVGLTAGEVTLENNSTSLSVTEQVMKGNIAIIKHTDDGGTQVETPETGATFQIYLKSAGSYANASDSEKDTIVCDDDGYGSSKLLPYGVYTVHQTKGWDGRELIADFDVYISEDGVTYKYLINNADFSAYVKVVKADSETGKTIPYEGAGFEIYDSDGHRVSMQYTYPEVTEIHTFYTNSEGYLITPEELPSGDYTLVEVQAPYGYVLDSTPVAFTISQDNASTDTGVTVVKVTMKDNPQKGAIDIEKTGEMFSSVKTNSDGTYTPLYDRYSLSGAVFEVYAAQDVTTPDGTVRYEKGELVSTMTTDGTGSAESDKLYLGKYTVKEKTAPSGFVNSGEEYNVELTYAGQEVEITYTSLSVYDERQKVTVSLTKSMDTDEIFDILEGDEILSVRFGLYAAEDMTALDGTKIPKDGLITSAYCDENGKITFDCDLPIGYSFYVKEMETDEHYVLSSTKYSFDTTYQGQDVEVISITANNGKRIENKLIYGKVKGLKTNRETGEPVPTAVFGLFYPDETEYTEENAILTCETDEDGLFTFENIPYGDWIIYELSPAEGYLENWDVHNITVSADGQVIELNVLNDLIPELHTTATVEDEHEICATEIFTLVDTVEYKHLVPGDEYTVTGVIMDKNTGEELIINGLSVTGETTFIPEDFSGTVDVEFTFDSRYIKEETDLVVFEDLYKGERWLVDHADIDDVDQTVHVLIPEIHTEAETNGNKEIERGGTIILEDTVEYENLTPGKEYVVTGVLMNKATGEEFLVNGEPVTAETTFTPEEREGVVTVTFEFDSQYIEEETELVVFEDLYRNGMEIAVHADIEDDDQTVTVLIPEIHTEAVIGKNKYIERGGTVTIDDTVEFTNLTPGDEYTLTGVLMDKSTGEEFLVKKKTVVSETTFTPEEADGFVTVSFEFNSKYIIDDTDLVVFETLTRNRDDAWIAEHNDLEDEGQTVEVLIPEIHTEAMIGGKKTAAAQGNVVIDDTVEYTNLTPGTAYTLEGVLMNKSTGKQFKVNGDAVTSSVVFIPDEKDGFVVVQFEFDAGDIKENTELVVFETLYRDDLEIASHEDIDDKGQTVTLTSPVSPKTGSGDVQGTVATVAGTALFGAVTVGHGLFKKKGKGEEKK